MPEFDITSPSGEKFRVTAPEGASQEEVLAYARSKFDTVKQEGVTKSAPPMFTPSGEKGIPSSMFDFAGKPEMIAANPITRFATGAASPVLGLAQIMEKMQGGHAVTDMLNQLEQAKQEGRAKIGDTGLDVPDLAGTVLSPPFLKTYGAGKTLGSRMTTGTAVGGAAGVTAPDTTGKDEGFWERKGEHAVGGAMFGGALPAAGAVASKTARMGYHGLIEPWANPAAIKGRAYLEAAGDKADEIINLLTRNKEIVPGSRPTAGEAASPSGRAEFSALQESAARAKPSEYLERSDQQNAARVGAIEDFAGTPAKLEEARAAREAAAGPHYALGEKQTLPFDIQGFGDLHNRPSTKAAVTRAQRLIEEQTGKKVDIPELVKGQTVTGAEAQKIKLAFDDLIKLYPKSGIDSAELSAIQNTRESYIKWMEANFPALREARRTYKAESAPINQMEVGRALEEKLTPALREDGKLRSGAFSSAVRDSATTLKKATGEPRFQELEDVLNGRQLNAVHNVQSDLARSDRHLEMARRGGSAGPNALDLATGNLEREAGGKMPNLLNRGVMLANAIISRMEGQVNKKLASEMAMEMLSPPKVAESVATAQARKMRNDLLAEQIRKMQNPIIGGTAAAASR